VAESTEEANGDTLSVAALESMRDRVSQENGYLTGFIGIAAFVDGEGNHCWSLVADPDQPTPQALGLLKMLNIAVEASAAQIIFGVSPE
jgi:hypothetical protein